MKRKHKIDIMTLFEEQAAQTINPEDLKLPNLCEVPSIEYHLRTHSSISRAILDAYYRTGSLPDDRLDTITDFESKHYSPFSDRVYGAYPFTSDIRNLKETMKIAYDKELHEKYINSLKNDSYKYKAINFEKYKKVNVLKRLESFARGFKEGYDSFIEKHVESSSAISSGIEFKVRRVIDFLSTPSHVKSGFPAIQYRTTEKEGHDLWYQHGVGTGHEYQAWYYIFINHKSFQVYFETLQKSDLEDRSILENSDRKNMPAIHPVIKLNPTSIDIIDPLSFIDPVFLKLLDEAEKCAFGPAGKFTSSIRCAAFCEILYERKWIKHTKTRRKTMIAFAKARYKIKIEGTLASTKRSDRNSHRNNTVNHLPGLKNCFPVRT